MNEAEFEANVKKVLQDSLPWLDGDEIKLQQSFSFNVGHAIVTIDGKPIKNSKRARADILVSYKGRNMALIELKKPSVVLSEEDDNQGLSYARLVKDMPPLVIISNGASTKILNTYTAEEWKPEEDSQAVFQQMISSTTVIAKENIDKAISFLLGGDPIVWKQGISQTTQSTIENLSGEVYEEMKPFSRGFLVPRKASYNIFNTIKEKHRLFAIVGGPLVGKSNILKELAIKFQDNDEYSFLLLDADYGLDFFGRLSEVMRTKLNWTISINDARTWLRNVIKDNKLIVAIDNIGSNSDEWRRDLEILTSEEFGDNLKVICAIDKVKYEQMIFNQNGRSHSVLADRVKKEEVGLLDKEEFEVLVNLISKMNIHLFPGAEYKKEFRNLWLVRSFLSNIYGSAPPNKDNSYCMLGPDVAMTIFQNAKDRFDELCGSLTRYRNIAKAILSDLDIGDPELRLIAMEAYVVRDEVLKNFLGERDIEEMLSGGFLEKVRMSNREICYYVKIPELVALELAHLISELDFTDVASASPQLLKISKSIFLGASTVSYAIWLAASSHKVDYSRVIFELIKHEPENINISEGFKGVFMLDGEKVHMDTFEQGKVKFSINGQVFEAESDEGEKIYDFGGYLVLSYLSMIPAEIVFNKGDPAKRFDFEIMKLVGKANVPVYEIWNSFETPILTHDIPNLGSVLCHKAGLIEPITCSLFTYLTDLNQELFEKSVEEIIHEKSLPLLCRTFSAINMISNLKEDEEKGIHYSEVVARIIKEIKNFDDGKYVLH